MVDGISFLPKFDKFFCRMLESGRYNDLNDLINSAVGLLEGWEMARSELSDSLITVHDNGQSTTGNVYKDLLDRVERLLGRNSSTLTGTKSW